MAALRTRAGGLLRTIMRLSAGILAILLVVSIALSWKRWSSPPEEKLFQEAVAGLEHGDASAAGNFIRQFETNSDSADRLAVLEGILLVRRGAVGPAIEKLQTVPLDGPHRGLVMLYIARALHTANRLPEAEVVLRKLVDENPRNAEARRWLGIIYFDLGAYNVAIEELRKLAELEPQDFRSYRLIGLMYRDFEQNRDAITAYTEALKRFPPEEIAGAIREELAETLIDERRYDEARSVLTDTPSTPFVQLLLARCDWNAGDAESALSRLKIVHDADCDDRSGMLLEAEILAARCNREAALTLLQAAAKLHPYDAECHYAYGLALRDSGQTPAAEIELKKWEELKGQATRLTELNFRALQEPYNAELRNQLAITCDALGKPQLAVMWRQAADACRTADRLRDSAAKDSGSAPKTP